MNNTVKKIDFTFVDYLTFIEAVVSEVIKNGEEYKSFYIALVAASMFYNYTPETDEEGNFDVNKVWSELRNFKGIKNENEETIFENIDLYKTLGQFALSNNVTPDILPIEDYIYEEMISVIDDKIWKYNNRDYVKEALAKLINTISDYVDDMSNKFEGININEVFEKIDSVSDLLKKSDNAEIVKQIAKTIHLDNKKNDTNGDE